MKSPAIAIRTKYFKLSKLSSLTFNIAAVRAPNCAAMILDKLLRDIMRANSEPSTPSLHF